LTVSRYDIGNEGEDAFEPGSDGRVLRNKLGVVDVREMDLVEARMLVAAQERSYVEIDTTTRFTVKRIRELHRWWLGSLYEFAGEIRTVNISKGLVSFAPVSGLLSGLSDLDRILGEQTPCEGMSGDELVRAIALVHGELLFLHPFREGNGRLARWLADLMALQAGRAALDWQFETNTEAKQEAYFAALRRSFAKDYAALEALIHEALNRSNPSG
jgi:cell filamentation protein